MSFTETHRKTPSGVGGVVSVERGLAGAAAGTAGEYAGAGFVVVVVAPSQRRTLCFFRPYKTSSGY